MTTVKNQPIPVVPLRDVVVFPHMVTPLLVGRPKSMAAAERAMLQDKIVVLATQKTAEKESPQLSDLFEIGTLAQILQIMRLPEGSLKILVQGLHRVRIREFRWQEDHFSAEVQTLRDNVEKTVEVVALMRATQSLFEQYTKLNPRVPSELIQTVSQADTMDKLSDLLAANVLLKQEVKQELLMEPSSLKRLQRLGEILNSEIEILKIEKKISDQVRKQIETSQKNFYLLEQMKAIEKELGKEAGVIGETAELQRRIKKAQMPKEAQEKALKELERLSRMMPYTPEAAVCRNYIDILIDLPWKTRTKDRMNLENAKRILDEDHYGLAEPKERILEYLAVKKLAGKDMKGPVLCFSGPPGVGKTSLAKSIARALGRKFVRVSLGGVRDEAEIRGHRRTYVGALPGRILSSMRKAGVNNPVFLLDEVDKLSRDFHGDPSAALLEVLDPEQNHAFNDHFVEVDFDLSEVLFITTANVKDAIHPTLRDRMEIIEISSYTEWEKLRIAMDFLIPKELKANGLKSVPVQFAEDAILALLRGYTREAGLRNAQREIGKICRKIAKESLMKKQGAKKIILAEKDLKSYLGKPRFNLADREEELIEGVATGLAWTEAGGDILRIEATTMDGRGNLILTGQLGDVMRESAQAAWSFIRSRAKHYGLDSAFYRRMDLHVHVPEGAIPKDGPSAGVALAAAIYSLLTKKRIRKDLAMTGEITLRGRVLRVGGIKEKIIAAHREGIRTVLLPAENEVDLEDVPESVRNELQFVFVRRMDEILGLLAQDAGKTPTDIARVLAEHPIKFPTGQSGISFPSIEH